MRRRGREGRRRRTFIYAMVGENGKKNSSIWSHHVLVDFSSAPIISRLSLKRKDGEKYRHIKYTLTLSFPLTLSLAPQNEETMVLMYYIHNNSLWYSYYTIVDGLEVWGPISTLTLSSTYPTCVILYSGLGIVIVIIVRGILSKDTKAICLTSRESHYE